MLSPVSQVKILNIAVTSWTVRIFPSGEKDDSAVVQQAFSDLLSDDLAVPAGGTALAFPAVGEKAALDQDRGMLGQTQNLHAPGFDAAVRGVDAIAEFLLNLGSKNPALGTAWVVKSFDALDTAIGMGIEMDTHQHGVAVLIGFLSTRFEGKASVAGASEHGGNLFCLQETRFFRFLQVYLSIVTGNYHF